MIVSNNEEPRVKSFADKLECPYVYKALKPRGTGYTKAKELMDLPCDQIICIGDQLFTDIWGANRAGMKSVLVGSCFIKSLLTFILREFLNSRYCTVISEREGGKHMQNHVNIDTKTRLAGLIGHPVGHSLSPFFMEDSAN